MAGTTYSLDTRAGGEARDWLAIYRQLMSLVPAICPEWTYRGEDDPGVVLVQLQTWLADHLHYRNDATFRDASPATTLDFTHMLRLAEWLGYQARRADSAAVELVLAFDSALESDQTIPERTAFTGTFNGRQVTYETVQPEVLEAGLTHYAIQVWEGQSVGPVVLGAAAGTANEVFRLGRPDAIYGGRAEDIVVTVDGDPAVWIPFLAGARPTQIAYWVREADDGDLEIRFGDGDAGRLLPAGAEVAATYRVGGGPDGRIGEGVLTDTTLALYDDAGDEIDFTVTNPYRSHGGPPAEDLESIRRSAFKAFTAQGRAVTREDYESFALRVPGVHRARAVRSGIDGVVIYVVPSDANDGPIDFPVLARRVESLMRLVATATDYVYVRQADLIPIDVSLEVISRKTVRPGTLKQLVRDRFLVAPSAAVLRLVDPLELRGEQGGILWEGSVDLGQHLRQSDMVRSIDTMRDVDYLNVLRYARRPAFVWKQQTGDAALADEVTISATTVNEEWRLTFTSETEFVVEGSTSGLQEATGELDTPYTSDDAQIAFTLEAGDHPMSPTDYALIQVSPLTGNIQLGPNEFPIAGRLDIDVRERA